MEPFNLIVAVFMITTSIWMWIARDCIKDLYARVDKLNRKEN